MRIQHLRKVTEDHWPAIVFFAASLLIFYFLATHVFDPGTRKWMPSYPTVYSGDEPHYLLMITSLLQDRDVSLANNYRSVRTGGLDAGVRARGKNLDHHTLIKDARTGQAALWEKIFDLHNPVPCEPADYACVGYKRIDSRFPDFTSTNPNYIELPKHPVPFSAVLALGLKILNTPADEYEAHSIYFIVVFSWLTGIVTYLCALDMDLSRRASLGVVALLFFASPFLLYTHSMVPASFMALLLSLALWAFWRKQFVASAVWLAIATMQSEAFVLIFPAWALLLYVSREKRSAFKFAAAAAISVGLLSFINRVLIGSVSIRDLTFVLKPAWMWRTFSDPTTGLYLFIPWCLPLFCLLVIPFMTRHRADPGADILRAIALGILPVAAVYVILPYRGGHCYGPRYWVPYFPWMAIALVLSMKMYALILPRFVRYLVAALVIASAVIATTASVLPPEWVWIQPPQQALVVLVNGGSGMPHP